MVKSFNSFHFDGIPLDIKMYLNLSTSCGLYLFIVVVLTPLAHLAYKRNAENGKNESQMHIGCCQSNAKRNAKCFGTQKVKPSEQKFLICRMENFNRNVPRCWGKLSQTFQIDISNIRFVLLFLMHCCPQLYNFISLSFYVHMYACMCVCVCHLAQTFWLSHANCVLKCMQEFKLKTFATDCDKCKCQSLPKPKANTPRRRHMQAAF